MDGKIKEANRVTPMAIINMSDIRITGIVHPGQFTLGITAARL
jgi:hypothetical protein